MSHQSIYQKILIPKINYKTSENYTSTTPCESTIIVEENKILDEASGRSRPSDWSAGFPETRKAKNDKIRTVIKSDNFTIKFNKNNLQVMLPDSEKLETLKKEFAESDTPYHSFTNENDKFKKIVMKAAPNMNIGDMKEDLSKKNINVKECISLKSKTSNQSRSYLITVPHTINMQDITKINAVSNIKVQWQRFSKKHNYSQCYKCQRYGHGSSNCNNIPRCIKCGQNHHSKDCQEVQKIGFSVYCCNCNDSATRYSANGLSKSTIDFAIAKDVVITVISAVDAIDDLNSDHRPLVVKLNEIGMDIKRHRIFKDYKHADWLNFREYINHNLVVNRNIYSISVTDSEIEIFTNVKIAMDLFIPNLTQHSFLII
nr:unnamed protein product [Callosobruchus chinensis]